MVFERGVGRGGNNLSQEALSMLPNISQGLKWALVDAVMNLWVS